jgi:peptidoglycan glycosyltransferase
MNSAIKKVGIAVSVLILVLIGQLTYLQVVDANNLAHDPRNVRNTLDVFNRARGNIVTSDGQIVATSVPVTGSSDFKYQRQYPNGPLYAEISGYQSFQFGNTGVEETYDKQLTGRANGIQLNNLGATLSGKTQTGNVVLSVSAKAQQAAHDALGDEPGCVTAIAVKTGAIAAMYCNPTFDPNVLATHDPQAGQAAFDALTADPTKPNLARAYQEIYPPGSSFKTVTSSVALGDTRLNPPITPTDPVFPSVSSITLPQSGGQQLTNFDGEVCGGDLTESLVNSCNTTFGQVGLDLGNDLVPGMNNCGVGVGPPPLDLPGAVGSTGPAPNTFQDNMPAFAKAAIGQEDVAVTPLEMALVAAGIGNGGVIMEPHVVQEVQNTDGTTAETIDPKPWKTCLSPQNAAELTDMMVQVVQRGTGTGAQIPGVTVAGKTGTAQSAPGTAPHAWFVAFAPAENPQYAVSVIIVHGGKNSDDTATGGSLAAPIAGQMLRTLLNVPG